MLPPWECSQKRVAWKPYDIVCFFWHSGFPPINEKNGKVIIFRHYWHWPIDLVKKNTKRDLDCWGSTTETVTCRRMNGTYCSMINFDLAQLRKYLFTYSDEVLGSHILTRSVCLFEDLFAAFVCCHYIKQYCNFWIEASYVFSLEYFVPFLQVIWRLAIVSTVTDFLLATLTL